jgi:hypothetical protein
MHCLLRLRRRCEDFALLVVKMVDEWRADFIAEMRGGTKQKSKWRRNKCQAMAARKLKVYEE